MNDFIPEKPVDVLGKEWIPVTEDSKEVLSEYDKITNHHFRIWE